MHLSSHWKQTIVVCFLLILVLSLTLLGSARLSTHAASSSGKSLPSLEHTPLTQTSSCGSWSIVPSPNVQSSANTLKAVSAISASDVWAVGVSVNSTPSIATLTEHWNGSSWSIFPSPNAGTNNVLRGVAAISSTNVWAVGYYNNNPSMDYPLVEQWNGASWNEVSTPSLPSGYSAGLVQVAAIPGTNELWAVGTSEFNNGSNFTFQTLIEQWNGTAWNIVPSPNPTTWGPETESFLEAITVNNANDAWAVGEYGSSSNTNQAYELYEHWNGTSWSIVADPGAGLTGVTQLFGATQVPGSDQFVAVGSNVNGNNTPTVSSITVIEQSNSTTWSVVSSPNHQSIRNNYSYLNSIAALSAANMWAVGGYNGYKGAGGIYYPSQTLIEHWNGSSWSIISSPNSGLADNVLNSVMVVPGTSQLWAVGSYTSRSGPQTLTEFYC